MGNADDGLALIAGLTIVGGMAYFKWYRGKTIDFIANDVSTKLTTLLDSIRTQLPALPAPPTFTPPSFQPANAMTQQPAAPVAEPQTPAAATPPTTETGKPATKAETGQLPINPKITTPPAGSGGSIVAIAGDFSSNNLAKQTAQVIEQTGCQTIVGTGDYSYDSEKAQTWFDSIIGAKWRGRMKGCIGNHDVHDPSGFLSVFGQSGWNSAYRIAPNFAVVFIDTERGIDTPTLDSLTTQAKGMARHVAYIFHKPYITSGNAHHPPSENKWRQIIEAGVRKHGIKLVVCGHNHLYEHFLCNGVHYITSGAAGRKFYQGNCQGCGGVKCINKTNGFLKVTVGNNLTCQFINNTSGQPEDTFVIGETTQATAQLVNVILQRHKLLLHR